ncbi:hypothetical protein DFP83_102397 [Idiomarina fontislapidosi]|uniref:TraB/GumN family protein n=1 Tax=Idiomarina fontislapidosi TaxID=263723 RepID=A0A432Y8X0_9GAMM|nr:TraB/GumN family protein [Idiomarina fontislapidosi]PYE34651.1 hypothetical protein DFP83_102397 [Idiomarina fontislapidosi]RUO57397.1 TraB/GumN family protein [Idiomarina fontislapidosi]
MKLKLVIVTVLALLWSSLSSAEVFYKAVQGDKTLWIMGTVHAAKGDGFALSEHAQDALAQSDVIWMEVAPEKLKNAQAAFMAHAMRSEGTLEENVDRETWQAFTQVAQQYGIPEQNLNPLNAWFAQIVLVATAINQAGYVQEAGVESKIEQFAEANNLPIKGLETVERQIDALVQAQSDVGEQEIIEQTLTEIDKVNEVLDEIIASWQQGDLAVLGKYLNDSMPDQMAEELLYKRNREWIAKLATDNQSDIAFIAVGAGHLVGDEGVLTLLEQKGYDVNPVNP